MLFGFLSYSEKRAVWSIFRPYKDRRFYLRDLPGIPSLAKPFLRESVGVGGFLEKTIGPDTETTGNIV